VAEVKLLALIHHAGRFGGAEKVALLHSLYLKKFGHDVDLFYSGPILEDWEKRVSKDVRIYNLPFGFPLYRKNVENILALIKSLKEYDKIIVHHHIEPLVGYYLSKMLSDKIVWYCGEPLRALWEEHLTGTHYKDLSITVKSTSQNFYGTPLTSIFLSDWLYGSTIQFLRGIDISTVRSYNDIIANSNYSRDVVKNIYGLREPVDVVYPGVERWGYEDDCDPVYSDFILAVGSFIPMKNYFTLLKAFKTYIKETGSNIKLVIVGDGPLRKNILASLNKNKLKNVIVRSKISEDELIDYYKTCRFVVHIAINEAFGLIPVEAGLYEKPAIVSNMGGLRESVVDEESGFYVDPYDYKDVATFMLELSRNEDLCREMGRNAKRNVLDRFTIEKSTKEFERLLISS